MKDSYLKQRRRGWYVRVNVHEFARKAFGAAEVTRILQTRDKAEASRLKHGVIASTGTGSGS